MTTSEHDGLIMYSVGAHGRSDFFGVELVQGLIYMYLCLINDNIVTRIQDGSKTGSFCTAIDISKAREG